MKHPVSTRLIRRGLWAAGLAGLAGACQPKEEPERIPPVPQLETLSAAYRAIDRTDTLASYWAPDSLLEDRLFQFTTEHRRRGLARVQFLPASAMRSPPRDTLTWPKSTAIRRRLGARCGALARPCSGWSAPSRPAAPSGSRTSTGEPHRHFSYPLSSPPLPTPLFCRHVRRPHSC